jgi:hypothetical protein
VLHDQPGASSCIRCAGVGTRRPAVLDAPPPTAWTPPLLP